MRDEIMLKYYRDQPLEKINECLKDKEEDILGELETCVEGCVNPCVEQYFKHRDKVLASELPQVVLIFYYDDTKETHIKEVPRYEAVTLVSNFGGQLGLMVGMSFISVLEVLVWFVLLLVERINRVVE